MQPMVCPSWFVGINLGFEITFLMITLATALTGYQAYRFFKRNELKWHSYGFGLLALSYLALLTSSIIFISKGEYCMYSIGALHIHAFLFLAGIMVLLFAYLDIKESSVRGLLMLLVLAVVAIFNRPTSNMQDLVFYALTAAMIGFIIYRLGTQCKKKLRGPTLMVLLGFSFLFIGQLLLAIATHNHSFFVASSIVLLVGYVSIAASRLLVKR